MTMMFLPILAPLILLCAAAAGFLSPGPRPRFLPLFAEGCALVAFFIALLALAMLLQRGEFESALIGALDIGISVRLDVVSVTMLMLVSFIGWVVIRYSRHYLDGEQDQGRFTGFLCLVLAAILFFVTAGNLAQLVAGWIASSLFLHELLLFYPERRAARRAARKKFVTARIGDVALIAAALLLWRTLGSSDLATLIPALRGAAATPALEGAAGLLALAACCKSAQFPTHGWLTEVMETPTPVSALLHAGVVNAGGFLLIRFADVMVLSPATLDALAMIGGFTALFGGVVMLTQPTVKTSLAWSTVAQMGFMILECGLGLFALALLHILFHSLYKAHSFLASGGAIQLIAANRRPGPVATPDAFAVARAFFLAMVIYLSLGLAFGLEHKSPQAIALGAILIFGVAYLLAQGFADEAPGELTRRTALYGFATSISYFTLQIIALQLTSGLLPPPPAPGPLEWAIMGLTLISFGLIAIVQAMFPLWAHHPAASGLRVHLSNGFYVNAIFDRMLGNWRRTP